MAGAPLDGRCFPPLDISKGGNILPRKPNYRFERLERERAKAARKAARLKEKADRRNATGPERGATDDTTIAESTPDITTDVNQS